MFHKEHVDRGVAVCKAVGFWLHLHCVFIWLKMDVEGCRRAAGDLQLLQVHGPLYSAPWLFGEQCSWGGQRDSSSLGWWIAGAPWGAEGAAGC